MADKELEKEIDRAVKGRLTSIESLAWNRQYDWSEKDRVVEEHLTYTRKDLLALLQPKIEEAVLSEKSVTSERRCRHCGLELKFYAKDKSCSLFTCENVACEAWHKPVKDSKERDDKDLQEKIRSLRERNEESGLPFILALEGRK